MEAKDKFWSDDLKREELIKDRETFVVYRDNQRNE